MNSKGRRVEERKEKRNAARGGLSAKQLKEQQYQKKLKDKKKQSDK